MHRQGENAADAALNEQHESASRLVLSVDECGGVRIVQDPEDVFPLETPLPEADRLDEVELFDVVGVCSANQ